MAHLEKYQRQFIWEEENDLSNPSVVHLLSRSNNGRPILSRTRLKTCVSERTAELKNRIFDKINPTSLLNKISTQSTWRMASHFPERPEGNNINFDPCSNWSILFALYAFGEEFKKRNVWDVEEAVAYFLNTRLAFMTNPVNKIKIVDFKLPSVLENVLSGRKPDGNSSRVTVTLLLQIFNFNIIPLPCENTFGVVGITKRSFVEDIIGMTDSELLEQYICLWHVKEKEKEGKQCGKKLINGTLVGLSSGDFGLLMNMLPSKFVDVAKFLIVSTCSSDVARHFNISPIQGINIRRRINECLDNGRQLQTRLALGTLSAGLMRSTIRSTIEQQQIFVNSCIARGRHSATLSTRKPELYSKILAAMVQVARDIGGVQKEDGDTPVNMIILQKDIYGIDVTGGVIDRITAAVNLVIELQGEGEDLLSRSAVYALFFAADLAFKKVKKNHTDPKVDQHYAAASIKYAGLLHQTWGIHTRFISADAKSLIKLNTSHGLTGRGIIIKAEADSAPDHDAGLDALCGKVQLYAIEMLQCSTVLFNTEIATEPSAVDAVPHCAEMGVLPLMNDADDGTTPWTPKVMSCNRPGLGVAFAHNFGDDPENGARNFKDILETHDRYPAYNHVEGGGTPSFIIIELDNSKGPGDAIVRFVAVFFCIILNLDYLVLVCNAGGHSKYNPVEKVNGALATRLKHVYNLPCDNVHYISENEKAAAIHKAMEHIVAVVDGASCSHTGGHVDVFMAHEFARNGIQIVPKEIIKFLDCKDKPNFVAEPMPDFGSSLHVSQLYNQTWRILHSVSPQQCVFQSKHTLTISKNPLNPDFNQHRGPVEIKDFFDKFGGQFPLPLPSNDPKKQLKADGSGCRGFMSLAERVKSSYIPNSASQLPSKLLDTYLQNNPEVNAEFRTSHTISTHHLFAMQNLTCARSALIIIELTRRYAKDKVQIANSRLKLAQAGHNGIDTVVSTFIQKWSGGKSNMDELKLYIKNEMKENSEGVRAILVQKIYKYMQMKNMILPIATAAVVAEAGVDVDGPIAPSNISGINDTAIDVLFEAAVEANNNLVAEELIDDAQSEEDLNNRRLENRIFSHTIDLNVGDEVASRNDGLYRQGFVSGIEARIYSVKWCVTGTVDELQRRLIYGVTYPY